ncbi:transposase family protein [Symbiopectobacterium purcellii]|uniref:transposase family protein n=1 Tax=Symbiopectobacterium purcellii TaxID=2871826 RepID=UPI003F86D5E0
MIRRSPESSIYSTKPTDETRQIGFIPMSKNGRRHDKRLLDKVDIIRHIPPEVTIWADTGFQGIDKQHLNTQIPKKGTRKRPLSPEQKQENKIISERALLNNLTV